MNVATKAKKKPKKLPKDPMDAWITILKLLAAMPVEERERCIRATTHFFEGRGF